MLEVENVKMIWETEFSKLVADTYGRPYQLQQQGDMLGQHSIVRLVVPSELEWSSAPPLAEWASTPIEDPVGWEEKMRWDREFYPELQEVANDLHAKGLMEPGDYVIHSWW